LCSCLCKVTKFCSVISNFDKLTRGDQKVLQLGYKTYITHAVIFYIFSCNINVYFQLLLSAVYALKIEFSLLSLRPCLHSELQWFIVYKPGSTDGTSDFLLGNDHWEPSLDCMQDGLVEHIHSCRELAEQPMTCARVHFHEKVKLLSDNFRDCFCVMTLSNLGVGSA